MKYFIALSLALFSAHTTWAAPTENIKRQDQAAKCGDTEYNVYAQDVAYSTGADHNRHNTFVYSHVGTEYPHAFNNKEGLDLCNGSKGLIEFPIVAGGGAYTGGVSPGPDRVIYHTPEANVFEFCGTITHTGAPRGKFVACQKV